jgi:phosphoribosylanthranilate isomerase
VTRVKFCGLTRVEDAELCVELGAWALGMIFVPSSPRRCEPDDAARIAAALRRRVELAGVFANAPLGRLASIVDALGLTVVQLHGDEGPAYCDEVARRTGAKVVKAVRVRTRGDVRALGSFTRVDFHLLDGAGGEPFEWSLARDRRSPVPLVVAGGLTAENVGAAIAATRPWAVDVASGTEASSGVKDADKLRAFAAAVAASDTLAE